jgi:hypothetical protein
VYVERNCRLEKEERSVEIANESNCSKIGFEEITSTPRRLAEFHAQSKCGFAKIEKVVRGVSGPKKIRLHGNARLKSTTRTAIQKIARTKIFVSFVQTAIP